MSAEGLDIAGVVVVVTGGGSGIGRQICFEAASRGAAAIVVVDFNLSAAEQTAIQLGGKCPKTLAMYADCGKELDMFNIITKTERDVGPIGLFVANAGVGGGSPGVSATDKEWATMGGVNTMQHIFWARHLVPRMVQRGGGYIVITSSAAGLLYVNSLMYKGVRTNLFATSAAYGKGTTVPDEGDAAEHLEEIGSGVAGGDGVLEVDEVAALTLDCVERGEFLVLPHKEVLQYVQRKASDTTRWVRSARKMAAVFSQEAIAEARAPSKL